MIDDPRVALLSAAMFLLLGITGIAFVAMILAAVVRRCRARRRRGETKELLREIGRRNARP